MNKNIAVVGCGYWGKNLVRNLSDLNVLKTICDTDQEKLNDFKKIYPNITAEKSLSELLNNPTIDAVVIATPAETHYRIAKESLLAGKDVFVEKPLSLEITEGDELVKIAKKYNRILMVGHILQYHPAVIKLKELVKNGDLGKVQYLYSNRLNIGRLRTEENILWSFAPHDISTILMLLDEEPIKVNSFGGYYLNKDICDTTLTTLEFKNDLKAHIFVSWLHPFKEQKFIVVGTNAMAVFDDLSQEKLLIYPHKIEWKDGKIPIAQKADYYTVKLKKKEPLKEELKHFLECIIDRKIPLTDGKEGLRVLKVLHFGEESLKNGGLCIEVKKNKNFFIHESSYIDDDVRIGKGTKIWHFSHILKGSKIGDECIIGQNVMVGPDVTIRDRCKIQNNVSIYKGVTLEDEVFCGPSCVFTNVYNPRAFIERKHGFKETLVKKGSTIGANSTIVCGVKIGKYSVVGAGAVIKSDVPDHAIFAGVPAKQIGWACNCGVTLRFNENQAICSYCNSEYLIENDCLKIVKEKNA